ncbi:MAG TPA: helix-turn-helix domain-containing protein [Anaeromyxobacteraceae bacterium]|nr:helix-turn-helix domain-containing protein [Anaeromyxobacteraceae bacterium]
MKSYGQFCSFARSLDLLGERWTLLIVRELLSGSTRFNDLRRGIPRVSRTMLSARLRELCDAGVVTRAEGDDGPAYALTDSGQELATVVRELGTWGQRWLPRTLPREELDEDALLWDIRRRIRTDELPTEPIVAVIEIVQAQGRSSVRYLLLRRGEVSLCSANQGFPEVLHVSASLRTLTAWWRGDISLTDARAEGMIIEGRREWVRAFPRWFERYLFADVPSVAVQG